ncbi:MAG: PA14 domain-containing protein [Rubripirellula sp.]
MIDPLLWCNAAEPQFQTLVPGIRVTRIPVELSNIDSLEYGPDGRLYAAGYDGRIHVLTDTNADGVEDKTEVFWDKPGDLLTPVGILPTDDGVYVAVRGKIALVQDTDGDGKADRSEAIVSGWKREDHNGDTRNDAAGIALDAQGNLYFSLGCESYNKAWKLGTDGKSHYDINSERGTILKVSPDRKSREVLVTGTRFIIGLDFNQHGDLFATDQEGDTWFPGGNPRDELLHVVPGRHYGFPFRHPQYLPDIVDEPSVVDFSPQHQSSCGFRFNEQRVGRKPFGPKSWEGDAIVTGFSRGKLWRTPLAKTRAGHVGKQIQFLAMEGLPTDVAISPTGDLVVTCHSGRPDWGSGPAGEGLLYKISYDRSAPQPVAVWPSSPFEFKVAFDSPIDASRLGQPTIEAGEFVYEGDQHEWIWPGYDVVKAQKQSVRQPLKVSSTRLSEDGRTLTLTTTPLPWRSRYGITLPNVASLNSAPSVSAGSLGEPAEVSCDLSGVNARWTRDGDTEPTWTGWLPHIDSNVNDNFTRGSAEHERLRKLIREPGRLRLQAQLLLPGQVVKMRFEGDVGFTVQCGELRKDSQANEQRQMVEFELRGKRIAPTQPERGGREQILPTEVVPLEIELATGVHSGPPLFDVSYHADFDPHERPLRLEHLFVPWAPTLLPPETQDELDGTLKSLAGDPVKGRALFYGSEANCSTCHQFSGQGGTIAADLTVTVHRDPDAVLRDIVEPNAAINPDFVSYIVVTDDGRTLTGLFQSADAEQITLVDAEAKPHLIRRDEIDAIRASSASLMPTGFEKLGPEKLRDLVAFLCSEDPVALKNGQPTGVLLREYWDDVKDKGIGGLKKHPGFPDKPTGTSRVTRFEGPVNWKEYFGTRIRGCIHPPQTGDYTFSVAADDHAELWISSSDDPADKQRIVKLDRWTRPDDWDKYPEQKSKPIRLEAGKRYYIEALQIEATVDDCLAVGWQLPDGTQERPIPGKRLSSGR